MENPRQGKVTALRRASTLLPPVTRRKKTASAQVITANVSSQPAMSCHAGKVNRKKFRGLPKIGSITPPVAGGTYKKSASVGHSAIIPAPVASAIASEIPIAMSRRTGSTGNLTGCWPMNIVWPLGKSGRCARFRARNDPNRMRNVAAAKTAKIPHCRLSVFQYTAP